MTVTDTAPDVKTGPSGDPVQRAMDLLHALVARKPGGEVRPQQEAMVRHVAEAFQKEEHRVIQAGTGVGKSYGYMIPSIASGKQVVISTATKQLSEQIARRDLPMLAENVDVDFTYGLIKGRQNYLCHVKVSELHSMDEAASARDAAEDALFGSADYDSRRPSRHDLDRLNALLEWANDTETGDRSDAPACSDKVWSQVSETSIGCPGASKCSFGAECFAEQAKDQAKDADIIVTNHAMVAVDMVSPSPMFDDRAIIFDEAHHLEDYLSGAWGIEFQPSEVRGKIAEARRMLPRNDVLDDLREQMSTSVDRCDALTTRLDDRDGGVWETFPDDLRGDFTTLSNDLARLAIQMRAAAARKDVVFTNVESARSAAEHLDEQAKNIVTLMSDADTQVRWMDAARGRQHAICRTAPLHVGPRLQELLGERTMIATSATLSVGGSFEQIDHVLGLDTAERAHVSVDVGTPFDYPRQVMLYVPNANSFPAPVGKDRFEHVAAVQADLVDLVTAAGGRTLALFTTRKAAEEAAAHLRSKVSTPVLCQGDAPPAQLIEQFAEDEATSLCATMGFWHGVDVVGPSLSCVVIDKIPFGQMDDPLLKARMRDADAQGRSGFNDIYVAQAATMIAQGFGRLVRSSNDRGVVAILDTRLRTKGYGRTFLRTLPPLKVWDNRQTVLTSLGRLTAPTAA